MPGISSYMLRGRQRRANECHSRAPPSILNVQPGQPVGLRVARRTEEDYVATPRRGFAGSGSRLGGVVPEPGPAPQAGMPGTFPTGESALPAPAPSRAHDQESISTRYSVDQTKPTTSVQVRLADGTRFGPIRHILCVRAHVFWLFCRMVARMNTTHTVRDLRNFINA
jgi:UBX domain-containing protein 1